MKFFLGKFTAQFVPYIYQESLILNPSPIRCPYQSYYFVRKPL
jgi:hypothetical protein